MGTVITKTDASTTELVQRRELQVFTATAEFDAVYSVRRALADYMFQACRNLDPSGRALGLQAAYWEYADPEDVAEYPSLFVGVDGDVMFDLPMSSKPGPLIPGVGNVICGGSAEMTLVADFWCCDKASRAYLAKRVQSAAMPYSGGGTGFTLRLNHYHAAHATFSLDRLTLADAQLGQQEDARRNYRRMAVRFRASVPLLKLVALPATIPMTSVTVVERTEDL